MATSSDTPKLPPMLTDPDYLARRTVGVPILTDPDSVVPSHRTVGVPILTDPDPAGVPILTKPETESVAMLTALDPTAGQAELSVQGSTEGDQNLRPNYHVRVRAGATDWRRMADGSKLPAYHPTPKGTSSRLTTGRSPSDDKGQGAQASTSPPNGRGNLNQSRLSAQGPGPGSGSAVFRHLNLKRYLNPGPVADCYVLATASPLAMAKDQGSPGLSTPSSKGYLLQSLGPAPLAAPAPIQSLMTPGPAVHYPCLVRSSTTLLMASNASVAQLSHPRLHRCALHVSLVQIQELRVRS